MTTDDLERPIDPALEGRLRRTLNAVAATITHDPPVHDRIVQPASAGPVSMAASRPERRKKQLRFRPMRVTGLVAAAAAATAIAAFAATSFTPGADREVPQAIALGDGALSQPIRDGGNRCLAEARRLGHLGPTTRPTTVNYVEHPWLSIVIYQTGDRLIYCTVTESPTGQTALGSVSGVTTDSVLRGPIRPEVMETQGVEGEYMAVAGLVSSRVARVIFDDGAGHTRQANLANGTFATAGSYLKRETALIISYDHAGKEIDRRPAFGPSCTSGEPQRQELPGTVCEPRERWMPQPPQPPRKTVA